jgi:hypothetical protein
VTVPEFTREDWWDEAKVRAWLDAYPCGFCGGRGADFRFPGSEGMFDLLCRRCGAHVGWMPLPPIEFMRRLECELLADDEDDRAR